MSEKRSPARDALPVPDRRYAGLITYDAKDPDNSFPPIEPLRPPAGAPNVLVVLLDDVGFGAASAFGGPCATPTAERLAAAGLKYNRFHTTALCSPTRQALLTGRNHHSVGMGGITEIATSAPGYDSVRPNTAAPLAETLKLNGYSTAQLGKCHEVPVWETSPIGPFDAWPTGGGGFEYSYGFIGGEAHQYFPAIYEGTVPVEPDRTPDAGYHFMADMTDKAIGWVRRQKALAGDKPFFMHFAPGATHAPHHVPNEWSDKYEGAFDQGWDRVREETFARQKALGVIPPDAELTERSAEIPAYDDMPEDLKPALARQMEAYMEFAYDGGGLGKGGTVSLDVDGEQVGEGRVDATAAMIFSADDTSDVGAEGGALVSDGYGQHDNEFSGTVNWVQLDIDDAAADDDHHIALAERVRVAMARQ